MTHAATIMRYIYTHTFDINLEHCITTLASSLEATFTTTRDAAAADHHHHHQHHQYLNHQHR